MKNHSMKSSILSSSIAALLFLTGSTLSLQAQESASTVTTDPTLTIDDEPASIPPALLHLQAALAQTEQRLRGVPGYRVEVQTTWKLQRATVAESTVSPPDEQAGLESKANDSLDWQVQDQGTRQLTLISTGRDRLRIEAREQEDGERQLVLDYQQPRLLRWAPGSGQYSLVETPDVRAELQSCALTHAVFKACAVEFLVMPHPRETVLEQVVQVDQLTTDSGLRFDLLMADGQQIDLQIEPEQSLPTRIVATSRVLTANNQIQEFKIQTQLTWQVPDASPAPEAVILAADAVQVDDLHASISGRGVEEIEGQPLPHLRLFDVSGKEFPNIEPGQPTLLYFWATWASPSIEALPSLFEYRAGLIKSGVRVLPINIAEEPAEVIAFLETNRFSGEVAIDPTGQTIEQLRIIELPAAVIVRPDGTVHAILQNVDSSMREAIAAELQKLKPENK